MLVKKRIRTLLIIPICIASSTCSHRIGSSPPTTLNDVHSQLNATQVETVFYPTSIEEIEGIVREAKKSGKAISISGGKHSMGGQQFGRGTVHISTTRFNDVISFDAKNGLVEVESGIVWPDLIEWLVDKQEGKWPQWGIRQKQTGADRLTIGGALSSNVHGRGLKMKPIVDDVESFTLINTKGETMNCSRSENQELFRLAIGGYGLFGVIGTVKLRLGKRQKLKREVVLIEAADFMDDVSKKIQKGTLYGDFQFSIDPKDPKFLQHGVFSTYTPVNDSIPVSEGRKELRDEDWKRLYTWAHLDKGKAFDYYSRFYLSTSGQIYWSDAHQLSVYLDHYHRDYDRDVEAKVSGSEMISEVYVERNRLGSFLRVLADDFRKMDTNVIYGTVRLIEKDDETFLPWAKKDYACLVINIHVDHSQNGIEKAKKEFRQLISRALENGGSFFLTYHRWATKEQLLSAYPQFPEFLRLKLKYDPDERFQSEWYRHYREMFASELKRAKAN